jgi:hypothetical protein
VASRVPCHLFLACILLGLFDPEDGGDIPPKRRLTFNGLQGIISQKIAHKEELLKCFEKTKASDVLASAILLVMFIPNDAIKC